MTAAQPVAVVTGAHRGLGFETARQLALDGVTVVVTSRDGLLGKAAADKLQSEGLSVSFQPLDVRRPEAVLRLAEHVERSHGRLDILVNLPEDGPAVTGPLLDADVDALRDSLDDELLGGLRLVQALIPLMRLRGQGRIVNLGVRPGGLAAPHGEGAAGRLARATVNGVTTVLAAETAGEDILVNAVDPAGVENRAAAADIVRAATLASDGGRGQLFHGGEAVSW